MFSKTRTWGFTSKRDIIRMDGPVAEKEKSVTISIPEKDIPQEAVTRKHDDFKVLFIDLKEFSTMPRFFICCAGIFLFYLIYAFFQELIFRLEGFKPYGMYLTLIQFAFYTLFSFTERIMTQEHGSRKIPFKSYVIIAFLTVGTMGFSNSSVGYLNYPTQVIFKCCKLIPVLIMGIFIQGKKYSGIDFTACLCMSVGLIFFTLADSTVQPAFSLFGVFLISLALCSDAVIGNVQEKVMKQYGGSNSEMVFYSYGMGFFIILATEIFSGQLFVAFTFCLQYPIKTYGYAAIFSLCGYLGINFVLTLIKSSGALIAVTVTTCRKAVTIILSFMLFAKPFTIQYVWSGLIVVLGIYLNIYSKNRSKIDQRVKNFCQKHILRRRTIGVTGLENV